MTENKKMDLDNVIREAGSIGICAHVRPDGDAIGSCLGMYLFIRKWYPEKQVRVYLERPGDIFGFLKGADEISGDPNEDIRFDLFMALDCSDIQRLGDFGTYFKRAKRTVCIDHHVTNPAFADENHILADASSTSEIVCDLIGMNRIDHDMAEALYTGMVHDTGVFQYSCTSSHTMNLAGQLMDKGINFSRIITKTFFEKTYLQQQLLGRTLFESVRVLDGRVIFSTLKRKDMDFFCAKTSDLEGLSAALRNTTGVEVSIFIHESRPGEWKVSLRSGEKVDVAAVAARFGGGGHVRAAGCTMQGDAHDVINNLTELIAIQLGEE